MKEFKACYYGFLVGDAMGVPVEFSSREILMERPVTQMLGHGSYDVPVGAWSDDSSMMIATMDSIATKKRIDYDDIMTKFSEWISFAKYTSTGEVFDIGRTTLKAIVRYQDGCLPLEAGLGGVNYNGNGSLMRMVPIAFYASYKGLGGNDIVDLVNNMSSLTHSHEISRLGCYIYVRYIMLLLDGHDKLSAYKLLKRLDYSSYSFGARGAYQRLIYDDFIKCPLSSVSSSGYVVDTLESVIWCINNTESFEQAIIGAINLGGDTDTIGALTGALAGIIYGFDSIPKKWTNDLLKKDYLKLMCTGFIKALGKLE